MGQLGSIFEIRSIDARLPSLLIECWCRCNSKMGEFILDYSAARESVDPAGTVLDFMQETYSAAADLARWDRAALDRHDEVAEAVRLKKRRPDDHGHAEQ